MATSATARISSPHRDAGSLSPGTQLLFRVRKRQISVFIFQAKVLPPGFASAGEMDARSFHLERWQRDGIFCD